MPELWDNLTPRLVGREIVLEPLHFGHAEDLFDASRDDAVWRWLPAPKPTRDELDAMIADAIVAREADEEGPFATVDRVSGRAIGSTRFLALRPEHRGLEIGWTWLQRSAWSSGANVEAKLLMLEHAFVTLHCIRVEFKTDAQNERSRAALAALPAHFEGVFRNHMVVPYGLRDSAYFSVIADEWPGVREKLERRLALKRAATG